MSGIDPTATFFSGLNVSFEQELNVEQVAQMAAYEAEAMEAGAEPLAGETGEPTVAEQVTQAVAPIGPLPIAPIPVPIVPIVPILHNVSGRYRSPRAVWQLVLRVDVDGRRPMRRISGDYYHISGATVSYHGSFVVDRPTISVTSSMVTITGRGSYTFSAGAPRVKVTIPRVPIWISPADATLQHYTLGGSPGAKYVCAFESRYFRTVDLEQDQESGVTPFASYNTGSLPSGGPARTLSVRAGYAEAGIEMRPAGVTNVVPVAPGGTWSNSELHDAMVRHFSLWRDVPQWKVWLFHAMRHDYGPGLLGIMFDQLGRQRQGCAVFYQSIGGTSAAQLRDQLYCCVHELGHCFNLYHSFHKVYMNPPMPNRLDALSWMNYPQRFPAGEPAFWAAFPFQFDDLEVIHLRHAFRNNIIIGGNPFGTGAALTDTEAFADPVEDNSGLRLELEAPKSNLAFGEPPVVEIKLYLTDTRGRRVHAHLHPNYGFVQVAVQKPDGEMLVQEPPIEHCVQVETTMLDEARPSIYESAYIGYDKHRGQIFDSPGLYKLRGVYYALDGSLVLSNVITIRVRTPVSTTDEEVAELFLGDEQGMLLYLIGSDSEFLAHGNEAFDLVLEKYAEHPLAVYAQFIQGYAASKEFKTVAADYEVSVREPQPDKAIPLLSSVVDASEVGAGLDNISLNMVMQRLARTHMLIDDEKGARETITRMGAIFRKKGLKEQVQDLVKEQQATLRAEL
jgi:hypothetical protein